MQEDTVPTIAKINAKAVAFTLIFKTEGKVEVLFKIGLISKQLLATEL